MSRFLFVFLSILYWPLLSAQTKAYPLYVNGAHPITLFTNVSQSDKIEGWFVIESDTLWLEGNRLKDSLHMIEWKNDHRTGSFELSLTSHGASGFWKGRILNPAIFLASEKKEADSYLRISSSKFGDAMLLSPTSQLTSYLHQTGKEGFQDAVCVHLDEPQCIYLRDSLDPEILPHAKERIKERFVLRTEHIMDYKSVRETYVPKTGLPKLDDSLSVIQQGFLRRQEQLIDSLSEVLQVEEDRIHRWAWRPILFTEIYLWTPRMLSFSIHKIHSDGSTEVQALHWHRKKDVPIALGELVKTPYTFQKWIADATTVKQGVVALHEGGMVLVSSYDPEQGIARQFFPFAEIKQFLSFFRSFTKW